MERVKQRGAEFNIKEWRIKIKQIVWNSALFQLFQLRYSPKGVLQYLVLNLAQFKQTNSKIQKSLFVPLLSVMLSHDKHGRQPAVLNRTVKGELSKIILIKRLHAAAS